VRHRHNQLSRRSARSFCAVALSSLCAPGRGDEHQLRRIFHCLVLGGMPGVDKDTILAPFRVAVQRQTSGSAERRPRGGLPKAISGDLAATSSEPSMTCDLDKASWTQYWTQPASRPGGSEYRGWKDLMS
jgi:hypothetical protein